MQTNGDEGVCCPPWALRGRENTDVDGTSLGSKTGSWGLLGRESGGWGDRGLSRRVGGAPCGRSRRLSPLPEQAVPRNISRESPREHPELAASPPGKKRYGNAGALWKWLRRRLTGLEES